MKKVQPLSKYPCPTDHVIYSELIGIVVACGRAESYSQWKPVPCSGFENRK